MTENFKKTIEEEIGKLPKELGMTIKSLDWGKITEDIGKTFSLDEENIENLQLEVFLVLIRLKDIADLEVNIEYETNTSKEEAKQITDEIMGKIFVPAGKKFQEIIKGKLNEKKEKWDQNLNFILSGGDYSSFLDTEHKNTPTALEEALQGKEQTNIPKVEDIRKKFTI
jgi:cell division ATPase FtsA